MKKYRKYSLTPNRNKLCCDVYIDNKYSMSFIRDLIDFSVNAYRGTSLGVSLVDVTAFDLELHSFLRISHQYIVDKDSLDVKIEDMFELENPNLV